MREHIIAWASVHWPAIGIGHGDPGTGCINSLINNSSDFLSMREVSRVVWDVVEEHVKLCLVHEGEFIMKVVLSAVGLENDGMMGSPTKGQKWGHPS